jgi:dCMP deaminase
MPPARLSNDDYYLSLLPGVGARGTCMRRQVGAIIVDDRHRVLAMGFNGPPRGFPHCGTTDTTAPATAASRIMPLASWKAIHCEGQKEAKGTTNKCMSVHAEINALLTCHGTEHTLYVSCTPCRNCALAIANTNIKRVVCLELYADDARHILDGAGIDLVVRPT